METSGRYLRPADLAQALQIAGRFQPRPLAGGTDFFAATPDRYPEGSVLDLSGIAELREISRIERQGSTFLRFGAMVTWSQVLNSPLFTAPAYQVLRQCAKEVGGPQIQNRATLVGNVCNASPAADGIAALLALGAMVEIRSTITQRWLPLENFVLGARKTALERGELVTAIELPELPSDSRSLFLKMGSRRYLVISIAMLAAQWTFTSNRRALQSCRFVVGACSPVSKRLQPLERWMVEGMPAGQQEQAISSALSLISPIDDVRADRLYRLQLVEVLAKKLIHEIKMELVHGG
jgi:CO/xanthine dehydrogenase FAD-binding subunit